MAPPEHAFPVSELEDRVHSYTKNYREKSRKLPQDFDLRRDCELFEIIQYSCTTQQQQIEQATRNGGTGSQVECYPFSRLFRRCGQGDKMFHVETTAWEGPLAWKPSSESSSDKATSISENQQKNENLLERTKNYFWSGK